MESFRGETDSVSSAAEFRVDVSKLCSDPSRVLCETFPSITLRASKFSRRIQQTNSVQYSYEKERKFNSVAAPRRVHTAYHSGKKLRITLEMSAPPSVASEIRGER